MAVTTAFGASACFSGLAPIKHPESEEEEAYSETENKRIDVTLVEPYLSFFVGEFRKVEGSLLLLHRTSGKILH